MVPEAPMEETGTGRVATGAGWYVLNAKDARWRHADGQVAGVEQETNEPREAYANWTRPEPTRYRKEWLG